MVSGKINPGLLINRLKTCSIYLFVAWALIIMIVSSIPSVPTLRIRAGAISFRLDYLTHAAIYVILAFLGYLSFTNSDLILRSRRFILITLALILFAVIDEFHQKYIPGRTFNPADLASNITGIIISLALCLKIFGSRNKITGKHT